MILLCVSNFNASGQVQGTLNIGFAIDSIDCNGDANAGICLNLSGTGTSFSIHLRAKKGSRTNQNASEKIRDKCKKISSTNREPG